MESDSGTEKAVIYEPLSLYEKLNLDKYSLYQKFTPYLLTREQLKMFGFPEEVPGRPGRAVIQTQKLKEGSIDRYCCRCKTTFKILPNGDYVSDSICRYHPKKPIRFSSETPYHGDYPCCNGNIRSNGCKSREYHVTAESDLHNTEFIKTTRLKHINEIRAATVYALDCEMVYTTAGMELAKVGLVAVDGLTVFESFVLPQNPILDFNTEYSGVTPKHLEGVRMTLQDVQYYILKFLNQDSILVGHGLENDLKALRLIHYNIVDTSVSYPHKYKKHWKRSLKSIAQEVLGRSIQTSTDGHNCIEDARTCMDLMLYKIHSQLEDRKMCS